MANPFDDIRLLEGWRCTWPRLFVTGYRFCFRVSSLSHPAHYEACTRNRRQGAGCKRLEFHCSRQADRLETGGKSETFRRASPCRTTVKKHFEFASESGLIEKSQLYPARRTGWGIGGGEGGGGMEGIPWNRETFLRNIPWNDLRNTMNFR